MRSFKRDNLTPTSKQQ